MNLNIPEVSTFPRPDKSILDKHSLNYTDIENIVSILSNFKNINPNLINYEIDFLIKKYSLPSEIVKWFLELFQDLEINEPNNPFKLWISETFPYFWKEILAKFLWKLATNDETQHFKDSILKTLIARTVPLDHGFTIHETWPSFSHSLIINIPMFLSENPWSLSDGFILRWEEKWFSSFGGWRSAYTRTLESMHNWKENNSLLWYLDYPRSWDFESHWAVKAIVNEIKKRNITKLSIHWASMWWKVALELALELAKEWIKVNKLFINWWVLTPEHLKFPWLEQEVSLTSEVLTSLKDTLIWIEAMIVKIWWSLNYYIIQKLWNDLRLWFKKWKSKQSVTNRTNEFNSRDKKYWDQVNTWKWLTIYQIMWRLDYLKRVIDFVLHAKLLKENVWEVIAINSVPFEWAKSDWMVSTDFPEYLRGIFWDKVKEVTVKSIHYMVPNTPWIYAKAMIESNK